MEEPPGFKKKKTENFFSDILRVGVVICSFSATAYYGGLCTKKYISNPATITTEMVPITDLPPLQTSICRQVYLYDCKVQKYWVSIYDDFEYYDEYFDLNVDYDTGLYFYTGCNYETHTFGLYANSSEEYWTEIDGRVNYKLRDLVNYIDTWNETSETWNRIYKYCDENHDSQLFRSQMVLHDEQTGFWCHTLLMDVPEKIRYELKDWTKMTYVVIHFEGDIHSALKIKNMIKVKPIHYVSNVLVNVNSMKLSQNHNIYCGGQNDNCSQELLLDYLNCSLPFDMENNKPICRTYDNGLEVVRSRLVHFENCQKTCLKLKIDYKEVSKQILLSSVRPNYVQMFKEHSKDARNYTFKMPQYANLISYKHEYTLSVALVYFGSMVGIFTGVSVISLLTLVMNSEKLKIEIKKWSIIITQMGISIYLLFIFTLLVNKYMKYPRDTSVNFSKTTSDFSLTVCSSLQIYGVVIEHKNNTDQKGKQKSTRKIYVSYDMFLMTNETFWLKWFNPRNIIDTLKVNDGSSEIDLLDENLPRKFSFLPIDNETVAACHTFQLTPIKEIDSLTLIYNEEVQVYFHNTGQLLYEWDKKQNLILTATKENVETENGNTLKVYDTAVILKMERKLNLDSEYYQSFDECVMDYGTEVLGDTPMKCFFSKEYNKCIDIISNSSLTLMKNFLQKQNQCKAPQYILLTSANKLISLDSVDIETEDIKTHGYDVTGSIGIKNKSQDKKPKIEFFFPKFTKLSQEYFSYTVGSFLGEFGGLVGILLGLSFLDLQSFMSKLKRKEVFNAILYLLCVGSVVWLLYEKIQIFVQKPTTASLETIDSKDIPISFTLCKIIYNAKFDGKFNDHTLTDMKNISIVHNNTNIEFLYKSGLTFDFVSYLDNPMMCKEFDLAKTKKNWIQFVRSSVVWNEQNNNLHLYIHPRGMFYNQEFRIKYPSNLFRLNPNDETNKNARVLIESYDISDDPHLTCSSEIHQKCVIREIIRMYKSSFGCTYPIQRELFGVGVCTKNELKTLRNITRTVINSGVCKLPCDLHYFQLQHLPSSKKNDYKVRSFTFYFDALLVNLVTKSKLLYGNWDYIYEIGGWIGLFLGYSVIGIYDDIVRLVRVIKQYIV